MKAAKKKKKETMLCKSSKNDNINIFSAHADPGCRFSMVTSQAMSFQAARVDRHFQAVMIFEGVAGHYGLLEMFTYL